MSDPRETQNEDESQEPATAEEQRLADAQEPNTKTGLQEPNTLGPSGQEPNTADE